MKTCCALFMTFCGVYLASCKHRSAANAERPLIFARPSDSVDFDLARADEGESINIGLNIFEGLVGFKPGTTELTPLLATSWEISSDGLTYTFHLRPHVIFQDGTGFDADAVVFNFERQWKKDHPAYAFGAPYSYWENMGMESILDKVDKVDPMTVRIHLKQKNAPFLADLAMPFLTMASPTALMKLKKEFNHAPVGTGPYELASWKKDDSLELSAFDRYWGEKPKTRRVIVRVIPDNHVRLLELKKGSIQMMDYPNAADIEGLKSDPKIRILSNPGMDIGYLSFHMKKPPFDRLEVRRALSMAIDRQRIVSEVFHGFGQLAKTMIPPMIPGYFSDASEIEYSPDKAKKLLNDAGVKNLKLEIWASPTARPYLLDPRKAAELIQADLHRIGVEATIVSYDWGTFLDKIGKGEHQLVLIGWSGDNGDPDNFLFSLWSKDAAEKVPTQNYSYYSNLDVNQWLHDAQSEIDPEKRMSIYKKIQEQILKDAAGLPLAHSVVVVPTSAEIEGYTISPTGARYFSTVSFRKAPA